MPGIFCSSVDDPERAVYFFERERGRIYSKRPEETLLLEVDWSDSLPAEDGIAEAVWNTGGPELSDPQRTSRVASVRVAGEPGKVVHEMTTRGGQTRMATVYFSHKSHG
jgi:hypothetical protein